MTGAKFRAIAVVGLLAALLVIFLVVRHQGERAGADHVTVKAQQDHAAAIADARADERLAANASSTIATSLAQQTVASAAVTHHIVENLRNAVQSLPPVAPGDPLPAAPVDRVRADLNAAIDHANRAAEPGTAAR
ncbi:hypothetical protein KV697_10925 [Sphingomonas sanguinis]|uniref:hypothetical protein n=1 Tax=Sphingomonas sanguinis TaxID=33051 RepID=UPI001C573C2F|nr:hypothetical protein [Sphingomonas sanguinis]QXT34347.1 hypothetical protein KV697_10925 [Sphingomonas sanguinis]